MCDRGLHQSLDEGSLLNREAGTLRNARGGLQIPWSCLTLVSFEMEKSEYKGSETMRTLTLVQNAVLREGWVGEEGGAAAVEM